MTTPPPNSTPTTIGPWREVAPGVHLLVAEPDTVNIGLVVGSDGALLIDCGSTPEQGRALRAAVAELTEVPLRGVVVTHGDRDHWFGLAAFTDLESWGHESLTDRLDDPATREEARGLGLDAADLVRPTHDFSLAQVIDLGGDRRVELMHLGEAHTEGDVVAYVPGVDVLFTGDLIEEPAIWFGERSSPRGWPEVLNMLIGMLRPQTRVVPGHGEIVDSGFVVQQLGALASLPPEAERLVREGVRLEDAEAEGRWLLPWPNIERGVRRAYEELGAMGVRRRLPLAGDH